MPVIKPRTNKQTNVTVINMKVSGVVHIAVVTEDNFQTCLVYFIF